MSAIVSASKGVFSFKNGAKAAPQKARKKQTEYTEYFCDSLWYRSFRKLWDKIEIKMQELNCAMFSNVLNQLTQFIENSYTNTVSEIPTALLLTGINMPDHFAQFKNLEKQIKAITSHVCILQGEECTSLKYLFESMSKQLIGNEEYLNDEDDFGSEVSRVRKKQCSISSLLNWYKTLSESKQKSRNVIVVIVPDFENFSSRVLNDFILTASSYVNVLPFVFIFGVATSITFVHYTLPCNVSSRINIEVFHFSPSTFYLNNVIENILFSEECLFHLGGKVFNLFMDEHLFYDLSVRSFIRNFKYAMLEHFTYGNVMALCENNNFNEIIQQFVHEDFENVRHLFSFRKLVESSEAENRIRLLTNDGYLGEILENELGKNYRYITNLHLFIKCLHVLVSDLPNAPLGKQIREIYAIVTSTNLIKSLEYKKCFEILAFQSKDEFVSKVTKIRDLIMNNGNRNCLNVKEIVDTINIFLHHINDETEQLGNRNTLEELMGRLELKEKLSRYSKSPNIKRYDIFRENLLTFLSNMFETHLLEPTNFHFHEIFFFNDSSIQARIIGSHRAATHTALNNPNFYLHCTCCKLRNDSVILSSMPDVSIAYKLHLEYGKVINLYDWLQSFLSIVDPQDVDDDCEVHRKPELQARFTQAVTELECLGFIASSKRKTDHVTRLTWDG